MVTINTFRPVDKLDPNRPPYTMATIDGQRYELVHDGRSLHIWHTIDPDLGETWLVCRGRVDGDVLMNPKTQVANRTLAVYQHREELITAVSGAILQDEAQTEVERKQDEHVEIIGKAIDKGFAWLANLARAAIAIAVGLALFALITGCSTYTHPCDCQPDAHFQAEDGHWYYGYRMADKGSRVGRKGYIVHDTLCTNAVHHQEP